MQKKVIALAVAGLVSGAAFAQSNVTIYGVADAGYVYSSGDNITSTANRGNKNYAGILSGGLAGSRLGFKGEEGLGNGLKAVFTLEYALYIDQNVALGGTGDNTLATRQAFVGLESAKLGTVALGRQYAPGFYAAARNDAFGGNTVIGTAATLQGTGYNTIHGSSNARWNNTITYASPTFSGFSARAAYSFAESGNPLSATGTATAGADLAGVSQGNNGMMGVGLNYANGPLNLDVAFQSRRGISTALRTAAAGVQNFGVASQGSQDNVNEWFVGGSYDFKVAKVFASYQDMNDNNEGPTAATRNSLVEASNKSWNVGVAVPVFGNGKVIGSYGKLSWDRNGAGDTTAWALAYTHSLSKRTTLYTGYSYFNNDNNVVNAAGIIATTKQLGQTNGTFTAGLNHAF